MPDRISPPSWTEWTRSPSERTPSRKTFDELLGELRRDGLVEVRASLFVQLAKYSYLHVKNALVDVDAFLKGVPDSLLSQIAPVHRPAEVEAVLRILQTAGLVTVLSESEGRISEIRLTERQAAGEVERGQATQTVLGYLRDVLAKWDAGGLVLKPSSFPTPDSVAKATGIDRAHLTGDGVTAVQDRPETNETNEHPFLQETIDAARSPLVVLQFWPLPEPKGESSGGDVELHLLIPGDLTLSSLVRDYVIPVLGAFFAAGDSRDLAAEIQAKYASYMNKYREKFASAAGNAGDRIDKVLTTADPEGEAFANAVYVMTQVLRAAQRLTGRFTNPVVYQAARIAYAHAMALRVRKRKTEKEAASRQQDTALLVNRLKEAGRPLSLEELKHTPDASKNREIGSKHLSVIELLPLTPPREGARPVIFELAGEFVHREHLIRAFLELREKESLAQRDRLAQAWAATGIPPVEEIFLTERDVSIEFLKAFELIHQERVLTTGLQEFLRDYVPESRSITSLAGWLWPEGHRGGITPMEIVARGLDPILYEDKERLKRRPLAGVLRLQAAYPAIVKNAWNIIFMEEGLFSFILRKIAAFFGGRGGSKKAGGKAAKGGGGGAGAPEASRGRSGGKGGEDAAPDPRALKAADLKKLKEIAPILDNRAAVTADREKLASQWNLKLDAETARRTRQSVDTEVARLVLKLSLDQMGEENSAKVALFLVERSSVLEQITSSRAFHRYLYLTALLRRADLLAK